MSNAKRPSEAITPARAAETASTIAQLGREMLKHAPYRKRITNLVGRSHIAHAKVFAYMPSTGVDLTPLMQLAHTKDHEEIDNAWNAMLDEGADVRVLAEAYMINARNVLHHPDAALLSEQTWTFLLHGHLVLAGHPPTAVSLDGNVAMVRSTTPREGLLRPDAVIGLSAHYLSPEWRSLKAGQCTLPADIVEFKRQGEDSWDRLLWQGLVACFQRMDLVHAFRDMKLSEGQEYLPMERSFPVSYCTQLSGRSVEMAIVLGPATL